MRVSSCPILDVAEPVIYGHRKLTAVNLTMRNFFSAVGLKLLKRSFHYREQELGTSHLSECPGY